MCLATANMDPQAAQPARLPFTIVINTCHAYQGVSMPVLLDSLAMAGIPAESLLVVCGQSPASDSGVTVAEGGIRVHRVPYTAEALTGLIHLSESADGVPDGGWILYIQDTMVVGQQFGPRIMETFRQIMERPSGSTTGLVAVKLLDQFSLSVGFYDVAWLREVREEIQGFKVMSADEHAMRDIKTWCEDKIFDMCPPERIAHLAEFAGRQHMGTFKYSETSADRIIEHYPVLDLYKFKSWDGNVARVGMYRDPATGEERIRIPVGL